MPARTATPFFKIDADVDDPKLRSVLNRMQDRIVDGMKSIIGKFTGSAHGVMDQDYAASTSDAYVGYKLLTATRTVTLPDANQYAGRGLLLKDESGSASSSILIQARAQNGQSLDGTAGPSVVSLISVAYGAVTIVSNGQNWFHQNQPAGQAAGDLGGSYPIPTVKNISNVNSGVLPIANGGTNSSTALTNGKVMIASGSKIVEGAAGTTTTVLHGNASGSPTYSAVDLTADVTGTLPINKGGTNGTVAAVNGAVVYSTASAYAMTAAGSSGQLLQSAGAASPVWAGDTAWTAVLGGVGFQNSWANLGAPYFSASFFKDASGFVHIRGLIKSGTAGTVAFTLPAGYRPTSTCVFTSKDGANALGWAAIDNAGGVTVNAGANNASFTLDGITFDTR